MTCLKLYVLFFCSSQSTRSEHGRLRCWKTSTPWAASQHHLNFSRSSHTSAGTYAFLHLYWVHPPSPSMPGFLAYSSVKSSELQNDLRVWDKWDQRSLRILGVMGGEADRNSQVSLTVGWDSALHILFDCLPSFSRKLLLVGNQLQRVNRHCRHVVCGYCALSYHYCLQCLQF